MHTPPFSVWYVKLVDWILCCMPSCHQRECTGLLSVPAQLSIRIMTQLHQPFYSVKSQHQQILYCKQSCRSVTLSTGETNEDRKHKKINKSKSTHLNFCQLKSCTSSDNCQDLKHKYTEVLYLL